MTNNGEDKAATAAQSENAPGGIFKDPQALSPERHGGLRLKRIADGFGFARGQHIVPVTAHEIPQMATHFPIIFVGPQNAPCAVMGFSEPINLFVSPEGVLADEVDPPAALRQYPFFLKRAPDGEQVVLCIDRSAPHFSDTEGEKLFDGEKPSKICENVMQFLGTLERQRAVTAQFSEKLKALDLFATREVKGSPAPEKPDEPRTVATYVTVDEKKLAELSDKDRREMVELGFLPVCYAMLFSQHNWRQLTRIARERAAARN